MSLGLLPLAYSSGHFVKEPAIRAVSHEGMILMCNPRHATVRVWRLTARSSSIECGATILKAKSPWHQCQQQSCQRSSQASVGSQGRIYMHLTSNHWHSVSLILSNFHFHSFADCSRVSSCSECSRPHFTVFDVSLGAWSGRRRLAEQSMRGQ